MYNKNRTKHHVKQTESKTMYNLQKHNNIEIASSTCNTSKPQNFKNSDLSEPDEEGCLLGYFSPGTDSSDTPWICRVKPTRAICTMLLLLYSCTQVCAVTPTIYIPTSLIEIEGADNSNCIVPEADLTQRTSALGSCATAARLQAPVKATVRRLRLHHRQSDDFKMSKMSKVGQTPATELPPSLAAELTGSIMLYLTQEFYTASRLSMHTRSSYHLRKTFTTFACSGTCMMTSGIITSLSVQRCTGLAEALLIKCLEMMVRMTTTSTLVLYQPTGTACIIPSDATTARTSMPAMQRVGLGDEGCLLGYFSPGTDSFGTPLMCRVKLTRAICTMLLLLYSCTQVCAVTPTIYIPTSLIEIEGADNSNCIVPEAALTQCTSALGSCATAAWLQSPVKATLRRLRFHHRQSDDFKMSKMSKVGQKSSSGIIISLSVQSCIGRMRIFFDDSTALDCQAMASSLISVCVCGSVCCLISSSQYCYSP
jgi:hypothetical protein